MPSSDIYVIRPGIIVVINTPMNGGVQYKRVDLNSEGVVESFIGPADEKAEVSSWQTTRLINDKEEFDRAAKVRGNARALITKVCSPTGFGWLCPEALETELNNAIRTAKAMVDEFNSQARFTQVNIRVMKGRIAETDEEAARAIAEEVKSLIEEMSQSVDALDPEAIRDAATKAKAMATMLAPAQSEKVSLAIEAARKAARAITHRVGKKGEEAAKVLEDLQLQRSAIESARFAFIEIIDEQNAKFQASLDEAMPAVELNRFDLDLESEGG